LYITRFEQAVFNVVVYLKQRKQNLLTWTIKAKTKKLFYIFNKKLCSAHGSWHSFYRNLV